MDIALKKHLEYLLCVRILSVRAISGGDISKAYLLETETERFFCKVNHEKEALTMFQTERKGLEAIAQTKTIATPKVCMCEPLEKGAFLLMEYIPQKQPTPEEMGQLGHQLAALHQLADTTQFGWEQDNFIGSLPQSNKKHTDWYCFYAYERLLPQLHMASDQNKLDPKEIPSEEQLLKILESFFSEVRPSLLHGDLWSGNYLISEAGTPYLIDPAAYYGHSEVDVAMTRLFGGFSESFYRAYATHFPITTGEKERTDIYQLYYLLAHLNLFGSSYYGSVHAILKKYF